MTSLFRRLVDKFGRYIWLFPHLLICLLQNESINKHHKNVKFMCADVTSPDLKFSPESVDLIFSNWLLMYLSDEEVLLL